MPVSSYLNTSPQFGEDLYLHETATVIGDVTVGKDCSIWCNTVLRGDVNRIVIGNYTNVQDFAMCHVSHKNAAKPDGSPLIIGDYVTIGHQAMLHGCTIGTGSLVGMNAVILNDARIGRNTLVGAHSLVPEGKSFPDGVLLMGSPAKVVRELSPEQQARIKRTAASYVARAALYRQSLRELVG